MSQHHKRLSGRKRQERNRKILAASDVCHLCGQPGSDAIDHVIPFARCAALGLDPDAPSNLKPAHHDVAPYCNRRKGGRTPEQAGMKLIRAPGKPAWLPTLTITIGLRNAPDSWRDYLYWNAELEE